MAMTIAALDVADEVGRRRECQQKYVQRVDRAAENLAENRVAGLMGDLVRAHRVQSHLRLNRSQTTFRAAKPLQRLLR